MTTTVDHHSAMINELARHEIRITPDDIPSILQQGVDTFLERRGVELSAEEVTVLHLIVHEIRGESNVKFTIA